MAMTERRNARGSKIDDIFNGLCVRWRTPISSDQRRRFGPKYPAAYPRLAGLRAILEDPTRPAPAFPHYSAAILTCLDTGETKKRRSSNDGWVSF